jgi:diadenosine tetraphosphate (Ap4A) HIT family hydrolase
MSSCTICRLHTDIEARSKYEVGRDDLWILRHHPDPAPLPGWLLMDARRHLGGPLEFLPQEAADWGASVQAASRLVQELTGCARVYAIAFGEGARHLHLHLIPRFDHDPTSEAWRVADLYRAVEDGSRAPATAEEVSALVERGRALWPELRVH